MDMPSGIHIGTLTDGVGQALALLLNDLSCEGWDLPSGIYEVTGSVDDPIFTLIAEDRVHPIDLIDGLYTDGRRLCDEAIGVCLVSEAWAAKTYEQVMDTCPELFDTVIELASIIGLEPERVPDFLKGTWHDVITTVPPAQLPDEARQEVRSAVIAFRDGHVSAAMQLRLIDETIHNYCDPGSHLGEVSLAALRFVAGQQPGEEHVASASKLTTFRNADG